MNGFPYLSPVKLSQTSDPPVFSYLLLSAAYICVLPAAEKQIPSAPPVHLKPLRRAQHAWHNCHEASAASHFLFRSFFPDVSMPTSADPDGQAPFPLKKSDNPAFLRQKLVGCEIISRRDFLEGALLFAFCPLHFLLYIQ